MADIVEVGRRLKRSLDGQITYRKAGVILLLALLSLLYLRWLVGGRGGHQPVHQPTHLHACLNEKLAKWEKQIAGHNAHTHSHPEFIAYAGNGYLGMHVHADGQLNIKSKRTLSIPVPYLPLVSVSVPGEEGGDSVSGWVSEYTTGVVTQVQCLATQEGTVTVTSSVYMHRTIPGVLVQDIKVTNPSTASVQVSLSREGARGWVGNKASSRSIDVGGHESKYSITGGTVQLPASDKRAVVVIAARKVPSTLRVGPRAKEILHLLTGVAYSEPFSPTAPGMEEVRLDMEKQSVGGVVEAAAFTQQQLRDSHSEVWRQLWTSGFSISRSLADKAINGDRINATMYYVLSHSPTPLHSSSGSSISAELQASLSYTEGCYSGIRTLQATNLWTPLSTPTQVDSVVSYWLLNLEKNGCHNLVKAGADGVIQAMVLSLPGLKFNNHHLEMNVHPRELHRDSWVRRLNYGNETHINISINVMEDNRAGIFVSLDKKNKDYYACDAGCLDPPVQLGLLPQQFPVKLTEPVTAILYITADHEHMEDLKHTIHVKEVSEAPAHEQHVLELHRTGARAGGLHPIFWISIAAIIITFHIFLFRLIYDEYCASTGDKHRIRKFSDYG